MTLSLKPLKCLQEFVKLTLKIGSLETFSGAYELNLFVNKYWWDQEIKKEPEEIEAGDSFFVSVSSDDLRIRHLPIEPSILTLFDQRIAIDHHDGGLDIEINAKIEITQTYGRESEGVDGFEGVLRSGSVTFKNFEKTFQDREEWEWLVDQTSEGAELFLGRSKIQLKLKEEEKNLLYEYYGQVGQQEDVKYLWKLVECPHKDFFSPLDRLGRHENRIIELAERVNGGRAVRIEKFPQPEMGVYWLSGAGGFSETYLKPALRVSIFQEGERERSYGPPTIWIPQSLKINRVEGRDHYTLMDVNQIELLLNQGSVSTQKESFDFEVRWEASEERSREIKLKGENPKNKLYLSGVADPKCLQGKYLWNLAKLKERSNELSWVRYRLETFPSSNRISANSNLLATKSKTLSGSLLKFYHFLAPKEGDQKPWKVLINIPEEDSHPQLEMRINEEELVLKLHRPNILAVTPEMWFYSEKLLDPSSMPADRLWGDEEKITKSSLVFENNLKESNQDLADQSIKLTVDTAGDPTFASNSEQTLIYKTAPIAAIDRVSPSRGNLVTKPNSHALERDPNHSLLSCEPIETFKLQFFLHEVVLDSSNIKVLEKYAAEALMPWVESLFSSLESADKDKKRLYHRNLVLEHGEFEASQVYRDGKNTLTSYNASNAFTQAVRDRYCLAADFSTEEKKLVNWLPIERYLYNGTPLTPKLSYQSEEETGNFPKVEIEWEGDAESDLNQTLAINHPSSNWLDYLVKLITDESEGAQIELKPVSTMDPNSFRTVNSYTPLLFSNGKFYDNLGIAYAKEIAPENPVEEADSGQEEGISIASVTSSEEGKLYDVTVAGMPLVDEAEPIDETNEIYFVTQLLFTCDSLKVKEDGTLADKGGNINFHQAPFNLGAYSLYSQITSAKDSPLSEVDNWPRYKGVPFLMTELVKFKIGADLKPELMVFHGVIANPEQLSIGSRGNHVPNFVLHSLRKKSFVKFEYQFSDKSLVIKEGSVDWQFSSANQQTPHPVTGELSSISGPVTDEDRAVKIEIFSDPKKSLASAFGKTWGLKEFETDLKSHAFFLKNGNEESNYLQADYGFHSKDIEKSLDLEFVGSAAISKEDETAEIEVPRSLNKDAFLMVLEEENGDRHCITEENINRTETDGTIRLVARFPFDKNGEMRCSIFSSTTSFVGEKTKVASGRGKKLVEKVEFENFTLLAKPVQEHYGCFCQIITRNGLLTHLVDSYEFSKTKDELQSLIFDTLWQKNYQEIESCQVEIYEASYLIISSVYKKRLHYHLPVELELEKDLPRTSENLEVYLSNRGKLTLYLADDLERKKLLAPQFLQGSFFCFLAQGLKSQKKGVGDESIILWLEAGTLGAICVRDINPDDLYQTFYFADDTEFASPCEELLKRGLDVEYLTQGRDWYRYTSLSLTLKKENFVLRFDDQNFSGFSQSSFRYARTGYLQIIDPNERGEIQLPVVVHFEKKKESDKITLQIEKSWFSMNQVEVEISNSVNEKPDIVSNYGEENYFIRKASVKKQQQFVALDHFLEPKTAREGSEIKTVPKGIHLFPIESSIVPINFCLEPEAVTNTIKLKKTAPQLLHRQIYGNMMRINLEQNLYKRDITYNQPPIDTSSKIGDWLLSPIGVSESKQLVVMSDNAFLQKAPSSEEDEAREEIQTESILIINRPISVDYERPPYTALSNRTEQKKEIDVIDDSKRNAVKMQILKMGANGIILSRKIDYEGEVTYEYIASPFYEDQDGNRPQPQESAHVKSESEGENSIEVFDFRSILPKKMLRLGGVRSEASYQILEEDSKEGSYQQCKFLREVSYEYRGSMSELYQERQPSLYFFETPAFKNMEPLWYLPPNKQLGSDRVKRGEKAEYFLPYFIKMRYGSDKPGSMFHHEMRNIVHESSQVEGEERCEVGKAQQFAMREAQQIKSEGCVTAAIENVSFNLVDTDSLFGIRRARASWEDIFGRVRIDDLQEEYTFKQVERGKFEFRPQIFEEDQVQFPLKVIVHHNFDVYGLEDLARTLPVYDNEAEGTKLWATLYLAAKKEELAPSEPVAIRVQSPSGDQVLSFNFQPYLQLAEIEIEIDSSSNRIKIKEENEAKLLKEMQSKVKLSIPNLQVNSSGELRAAWEIDNIEGQFVTLKEAEGISGTGSKLLVVVPLFDVIVNQEEVDGYHLWTFNLSDHEAINGFTKFQIVWLAVDRLRVGENEEEMQQLASCKLYTHEKEIKPLMPSITTPKIAAVLHSQYEEKKHKKTLFFGNGASPEEGAAKIELGEDGPKVKVFAYDNEEVDLSLPLKDEVPSTHLYLIKYLVHGQVVYGDWRSHES
ncbi:MAG: hypothetical protein SNF33_03685 [Candidatus Algichlamydia australiensis]|nr:hypothetical protein [Chlamydiales bacterium]